MYGQTFCFEEYKVNFRSLCIGNSQIFMWKDMSGGLVGNAQIAQQENGIIYAWCIIYSEIFKNNRRAIVVIFYTGK
jgi:hypothetical protein